MEKKMEKEKNIMKMEFLYMRENIRKGKKMEKGKNIMIMEIWYLMENM